MLNSPLGEQWPPSQKQALCGFSSGVPNTFEGGANLNRSLWFTEWFLEIFADVMKNYLAKPKFVFVS